MRIDIDDKKYALDLSKVIELMRMLYKHYSSVGLTDSSGKTFKLNGLTRTSIKALLTPLVIPQIKRMYAERNLELAPPEKHADLIDYSVNALLDFMLIAGENTHAILTSETRENSRNAIIRVVALWETPDDRKLVEATESTKD